jgi:hypothetical protein
MVAALWSFCNLEYYKSGTEELGPGTILALHVVAVCTSAEYEERLRCLKEHLNGDHLYTWRMEADRKLTLISTPDEPDFPTSHSRLFGLHHIKEKSHQGLVLSRHHIGNT